ncbi:acyl-CoA thioesterase [Bacteroidota bacterium]
MNEKDKSIPDIRKEAANYKFRIKSRVKFSEVDSFNVVHNLQYFYWLEWARLEYIRALGIEFEPNIFISKYMFTSVHAEIDYFNAARFDDEYEVLAQIVQVKNSSATFRNIIMLTDGTILVKASAVLVHLNSKTQEAERIPDDLRKKLADYEGSNVEFLD